MTVLELIRGSATLNISDNESFIWEGEDSFGMPPVNNLTERSALQHGVTHLGFRLQPRIIQLALVGVADTQTVRYTRRTQLVNMLAPNDDGPSLALRFTLPDGATRQIDCVFNGGLTLPRRDKVGQFQRFGFELLCPDPTWYNPTGEALTFNLSGGPSGAIPMAVPTPIGASAINQTRAVTYAGSWITYPVIRIYGPITDPILENETTDEILDFTGTTIANGKYYEIDCRFGAKTVVDSDGANRIATLTAESDLATFHLAPDPESVGGYNSLRVTGSAVSASTKVEVTYFARYLGV